MSCSMATLTNLSLNIWGKYGEAFTLEICLETHRQRSLAPLENRILP